MGLKGWWAHPPTPTSGEVVEPEGVARGTGAEKDRVNRGVRPEARPRRAVGRGGGAPVHGHL